MKTCKRCQQELSLDNFYSGKAHCKTCIKMYMQAYHQQRKEAPEWEHTREKKRLATKKYRETHPEYQERCRLQAKAKWQAQKALIQNHRAEFQTLLREAKRDMGLL